MRDRFTLTQNPDGTTFTLRIADSVTAVTRGEFAAVTEYTGDDGTITKLPTVLEDFLGTKPGEAVTAVILPPSLRIIGPYGFLGHEKVGGALTIPGSVTTIEEGAFLGIGLKSKALGLNFQTGSKLTRIDNGAFQESGITGLGDFPPSLQTIGPFAFQKTRIVTNSLTIPANVTSIGSSAFFESTGITGTLTIESDKLTRTPADTTQLITGRLGVLLFVGSLETFTIPNSPFTTIKLPLTVYRTYSALDLDMIFGIDTSVSYKDLSGTDHASKSSS